MHTNISRFLLWERKEVRRRRERKRKRVRKVIAGHQLEKSFWDLSGLEPSGTWSPRTRKSTHEPNAPPGHLRMVWWCIQLTRLTLVCEMIRYRLVQVRQNLKMTSPVAVANRLRRRTSDQTVLGSNPAVAAALSPWTRLLLPLSQGEAFTLASISYLAILVKYILAKKKKKNPSPLWAF